jgi:ribosomal protein S18 acetylase RimI-like enzyme
MLVERLTRADKTEAVEVLASAFEDYPVMRFVLRDAGEAYPSHLRALVGFFCELRFTRGYPILGVRDDGRLAAVAGINEPEPDPWPPALRQRHDELAELVGRDAVRRLDAFEQASSRHEPAEPHYYLGIIGVRPDAQGRGHARALIEELRRMSDAHARSTGISLSTERAENLPFYRHLGFEVIGESEVENLRTWCLFRTSARGGDDSSRPIADKPAH